MCCNTTSQYGKRQKTARFIAVLVCVLFVAALALSAAFIVTHESHIHDHNGADGGCATCAHISAAENLLKTIAAAVAVSSVALGAMFAALLTVMVTWLGIADYTLIGLKVRINN
ncbi:hypothetical protein FACS189499_09500 [Clostridia bacterium]|nr:hypothetical protein FACS189499_09500 [Clostridia bacterium]